jgi:hypothetical protein
MRGGYNDMIILNAKFKKFLKFKHNEIKYNVILNYLLCNYFDNSYEDNDFTKNLTFILRQNFKSFLINNKLYNGDDYSRDGVIKLLENFITKKIIIIKI